MSKEKPTMFILGSRGFLGVYAAQAAASEFAVVEGNRTGNVRPGSVTIDIRDDGSVKAAFETVAPDVVFLLAALSDIDYCQQFPAEATAVNLRGAEHVAAECARRNTRLLFTSSGAVFDGLKHGYYEDSPVCPVSVYGETKARAEVLISELVPQALIFRLSLVIGFAGRPGTNALLDNLKQRWISGQSVALPVFERRNPIDAATCAQYMLDLIRKQERGIFNIGCRDSVTRYDLGLKIARRMGYADQVTPQLEPPPNRAARGPDQFLLTDKLRALCKIPIPTCDQVVERCV